MNLETKGSLLSCLLRSGGRGVTLCLHFSHMLEQVCSEQGSFVLLVYFLLPVQLLIFICAYLYLSGVMRKHVFHMQKKERSISAAHPCRLMSALIFHCLYSIISLFALFKSSSLQLSCLAKKTGLCLTW